MNPAHEPVRGFVCAKCRDYKTRHDEDAARLAGCPDDVCEGCFDLGLKPPTLWAEDDGADLDEIALVIERWHVEHDLPCPSDENFRGAKVLAPVGECVGGAPYTGHADVCRVVMPNGSVYVLDIEYDADLRGDSWHQSIEFAVAEAEVVR
jgi:hypothetical protein